MATTPLAWLTAFWLLFEIIQLVACERFLRPGDAGAHARACVRARLPCEGVAFAWSALLLLYFAWMLAMLFHAGARVHAAFLLLITLAGFLARRASSMARILPVLRFEGAIRMGLLVSILVAQSGG